MSFKSNQKFLNTTDLAEWVVGVIQDDNFRSVIEFALQFLGVQFPVSTWQHTAFFALRTELPQTQNCYHYHHQLHIASEGHSIVLAPWPQRTALLQRPARKQLESCQTSSSHLVLRRMWTRLAVLWNVVLLVNVWATFRLLSSYLGCNVLLSLSRCEKMLVKIIV